MGVYLDPPSGFNKRTQSMNVDTLFCTLSKREVSACHPVCPTGGRDFCFPPSLLHIFLGNYFGIIVLVIQLFKTECLLTTWYSIFSSLPVEWHGAKRVKE